VVVHRTTAVILFGSPTKFLVVLGLPDYHYFDPCLKGAIELSRSPHVTCTAEFTESDVFQRRTPNKEIVGRIFIWISRVKRRGCRLRKQLEDSLAVLFVPHNMANSQNSVALLRSKHRVFSNTSCVFKIKTDFTIDRGSFLMPEIDQNV